MAILNSLSFYTRPPLPSTAYILFPDKHVYTTLISISSKENKTNQSPTECEVVDRDVFDPGSKHVKENDNYSLLIDDV